MKMTTMDYWYQTMLFNTNRPSKNLQSQLEDALSSEYPEIFSLVMERSCNLDCAHCFFQRESSSFGESEKNCLESKILKISSQLLKGSSVVHEGRILKDWHIPILRKIQELRPDIGIGLLDNGSYLRCESSLKKNKLIFDWIDISIDGTEKIHNEQRRSQKSYTDVMEGLLRAKEFSKKTTCLFTASRINLFELSKVAELLATNHLADELHVTPASRVVTKKNNIIMDFDDYFVFWKQYKKAKKIGDKYGLKVFLRFYQLEDMKKLFYAVGRKKFSKGFLDAKSVLCNSYSVSFLIEGIRIIYVPMSTCIAETFVIDADAVYRLPYCILYTLKELQDGMDHNGNKIKHFSVSKIKNTSSFRDMYSLGSKQWFRYFGKVALKEEKNFFGDLVK